MERDGSSPTSHVDKYNATKVTSGVSLPWGSKLMGLEPQSTDVPLISLHFYGLIFFRLPLV